MNNDQQQQQPTSTSGRGEGFINEEEIEEEIELDSDDQQKNGTKKVGDFKVEDLLEELAEDMDDDDGEEEEEIVDDAIGIFEGHEEAVLCCDVSQDDRLVVTGGQDDRAIVWEAATQAPLFTIRGHKDSVVVARFNATSSLVATADMAGLVQVFDTAGERRYDFEVDDINWMLWHPVAEQVLLAGTKAGDAWMWKLSATSPQTKTFQSFGCENMVAKAFKDGKRVAMGYEDGTIRIWDLKEVAVVHTISGAIAHREHVICMDLNADDSLLATGSLDSTVKVFNTATGKPVLTISIVGHKQPVPPALLLARQQQKQQKSAEKSGGAGEGSLQEGEEEEEEGGGGDSDSVESVAFSGKSLLALGSVNGVFEIWDVAAGVRRHELNLGGRGVCKIAVDRTSAHLLYTGCLDGQFRVLDMRSCEVVASRTGHTDSILDFAISADSRYALTTSEDATCRIFSLA